MCVYICVCVCVYIYIYIYMCVCVCVCVCICVCIYICVCVYMYMCIYIYSIILRNVHFILISKGKRKHKSFLSLYLQMQFVVQLLTAATVLFFWKQILCRQEMRLKNDLNHQNIFMEGYLLILRRSQAKVCRLAISILLYNNFFSGAEFYFVYYR